MAGFGSVAPQAESTVDSAQIEALRDVVNVRDRTRNNRQRARWCSVLGRGVTDVTLGLVSVLKPEMWPKLDGAWRQVKVTGSFYDRVDRSPKVKAQIAHRDFYSLNDRG